jgi:hypothetical protein
MLDAFGMHDVQVLLSQLVAQLESAMPNPALWNSSAARALQMQLEQLQYRLRQVQASLL